MRPHLTLCCLVVAGFTALGCGSAARTVTHTPETPLEPWEPLKFPENVDVTYYEVYGGTSSAIRVSMSEENKNIPSGGEFDGYTRWNLSWSYQYDTIAGTCRVTDVTTELAIDVFLPSWTPTSDRSQTLVRYWRSFSDALALHELHHVELAMEATADLENAIRSVPGDPSCDVVQTRVNATAAEALAHARQVHVDYDRDTEHGRTEGAVFPP